MAAKKAATPKTGSIKGKPGRKAFEPTKAQRVTVEVMTVATIPQEVIARCIGIHRDTLQKHLREELDLGKSKIDARITETIVRQALAGNTALLCFYAKTRMGWRETTRVETTGADGGPQEHVVTHKRYEDMTREELEAEINARSAST